MLSRFVFGVLCAAILVLAAVVFATADHLPLRVILLLTMVLAGRELFAVTLR